MRLSKFDPQVCRNHILLIKCPQLLDYYVPERPADSDGVMAYCYLDPLRGYRLLICAVIRVNPLKVYDNCYISMDIAYNRLGGAETKIYKKSVNELNIALQKIIYEVKRSIINTLMLRLSRMDLEDWKISRKW